MTFKVVCENKYLEDCGNELLEDLWDASEKIGEYESVNVQVYSNNLVSSEYIEIWWPNWLVTLELNGPGIVLSVRNCPRTKAFHSPSELIDYLCKMVEVDKTFASLLTKVEEEMLPEPVADTGINFLKRVHPYAYFDQSYIPEIHVVLKSVYQLTLWWKEKDIISGIQDDGDIYLVAPSNQYEWSARELHLATHILTS